MMKMSIGNDSSRFSPCPFPLCWFSLMFPKLACLAICLLIFVAGSPTSTAQELSAPIQVSDASELSSAITRIGAMRKRGIQTAATIQLASGTYALGEPLRLSGETVGDGLTIRSEKSGAAILSGGKRLRSPTRDEQGRWRFAMPSEWKTQIGVPRVILVDGQLQAAARWPKKGYLRVESALPDRRSGFTYHPNDLPAKFSLQEKTTCDLVLLHDWSSSRIPVASIESSSRQLKTVGPIGCQAKHYAIDHFEKHPRYSLEGHPSFADTSGDWFVDQLAGEIVVVGSPEQPEAPQVVLPWIDQILIASGDDDTPLRNLVLEGIAFTATRFAMSAGGLAGSQATNHERRAVDGSRQGGKREMLVAAVLIERATGCRVTNCQFESLGNSGLWIGSRTAGCRVQRCRFSHIGGNAINVGETSDRLVQGKTWYVAAPKQVPSQNQVTACDIRHCGELMPGAVAIWAGVNDSLQIGHNTIRDCPYTGISLGWVWNASETPAVNNRIHDNRIEYVMQMLSDGGGVYTLGRQPGSVIENNFIADIPLNAGRAESNGMFLDQGSTGFAIRGNTFRRLERSPLRFHQAGKNEAHNNRWELGDSVPPVRFNTTAVTDIAVGNNEVLKSQSSYYLIGNSLTWDTLPSRLDGNVHWHVDCGKSLPFIQQHPGNPCIASSRLWPVALARTMHDFVSVQPHYGSSLEEDVAVISNWMEMQPTATFIIHTGWARSATRAEEYGSEQSAGPMKHSPVYMKALMQRLRSAHPGRQLRQTHAIDLLARVAQDIESGKAPIKDIAELHRDAVHMTIGGGRYLMHNAMRAALGQPLSDVGFEKTDPQLKAYLDTVLATLHD